MNEPENPRGQRIHIARPLLCLVFVLQRIGDAVLYYSSTFPAHPMPAMRGLAFGAVIWSTTLLVMVWRRHRWARYILVAACWVYAAVLAGVTIDAAQDFTLEEFDPRAYPMVAALIYALANVLMVTSRRLRKYAAR